MDTGNRLDNATYDVAKPYLKAALEQIIATGHSVRDLAEFATDKFGSSSYPYLREFQQDIRAGKIKVQGLRASAEASILAEHVSPEERESMIREAAYLIAESRGFAGGDPKTDWLMAETQIDEMLAKQSGLFELGKDTRVMGKATPRTTAKATTTKSTAEKEHGSIRDVVLNWIEGKWRKDKTPADGAAAESTNAEGTSDGVDSAATSKSAGKPARTARKAAETRRTSRQSAGSEASKSTGPESPEGSNASTRQKTSSSRRQSGRSRGSRAKLTVSRDSG